MAFKQTPSQTAGPFFHYMLTPEQSGYDKKSIAGPAMVDASTVGERIRVSGLIVDGQGQPMADALVEIWQADGHGRYAHPADPRSSNATFTGFGRVAADKNGIFTFDTVKPGSLGDGQAPHITLILFTRGGQNHLYTRIYFGDEAAANALDPVLAQVPGDRRETLIARRDASGYRFDIRVKGDGETLFFDV